MTELGPLNPERWLDEHGDILFRYALARVQNDEQAEDLVQETLAGALQSQHRYEGQATERNWLIGILKHKVIDHLRQRYREQPLSEFALSGESDESLDTFFDRFHHLKQRPAAWRNPRAALEEKEFWNVLNSCLKGIPQRWATAFQLRVIEKFSYQEACQILNVTSTNLGALLHRARLRLRECLETNWFLRLKRKKRD